MKRAERKPRKLFKTYGDHVCISQKVAKAKRWRGRRNGSVILVRMIPGQSTKIIAENVDGYLTCGCIYAQEEDHTTLHLQRQRTSEGESGKRIDECTWKPVISAGSADTTSIEDRVIQLMKMVRSVIYRLPQMTVLTETGSHELQSRLWWQSYCIVDNSLTHIICKMK